MRLGIFLSLFILDATTWLGESATISSSFVESPASVRGIRYKTKRHRRSTTTIRPTWRPIKIWQDEPPKNRRDVISDETFPDDYYDNYDGEKDGTMRNILLHKTFEQKYRIYVDFMRTRYRSKNLTTQTPQSSENLVTTTTTTTLEENAFQKYLTPQHPSLNLATRSHGSKKKSKTTIGRVGHKNGRWSKKKGLLHRLI